MDTQSSTDNISIATSKWEQRSEGRTSSEFMIDLGAVSGDRHADSLLSDVTTAAPSRNRPISNRRPTQLIQPITPAARHATKALMAACLEDLERAVDNSELFDRNNAIEHFKGRLGLLWKMRKQREPSFAELINSLQLVFVNRSVENFSNSQLTCLKEAMRDVAAYDEYDDESVNSATVRLIEGGFDVFRGID
jgi:hypothetical protein